MPKVLKKELFYSFLDRRNVFGVRQSNQTILLKKRKGIVDSDKMILTDKRGYRYARDISLEQFSEGNFVLRLI